MAQTKQILPQNSISIFTIHACSLVLMPFARKGSFLLTLQRFFWRVSVFYKKVSNLKKYKTLKIVEIFKVFGEFCKKFLSFKFNFNIFLQNIRKSLQKIKYSSKKSLQKIKNVYKSKIYHPSTDNKVSRTKAVAAANR